MYEMKEGEYYGTYELRSRKVILYHPEELKRVRKSRKTGSCLYLQAQESDRALAIFMDPPPLTLHERDAFRQRYKARCLAIATTALSEFNKQQNVEYELVDPSTIQMIRIRTWKGIFAHCNFGARPNNDPSAPVELFFTESRLLPDEIWPPIRFCSLGPKDSDPGVTNCDEGCRWVDMRHPTDGVYLNGPHTPYATLEPTPVTLPTYPTRPTVKRWRPRRRCPSESKN